MFSDWLHPGRGYQDAQQTVQQGYDTAAGYQQPFMQQGLDAGGTLSEQLKRLMDPAGMQAEWAKGYETSPMAQQDMAQAQEHGMGAASAMGLMGSTPAMQNIQTGAHDIMNRDRQQYMQDLMQKYTAGLGIGKDMYGIGAQTAGQMGQQSIQGAQDQAQLGLAGKQAGAQRFGDILGAAGQIGIGYLTGGMGQGGYGRGAMQPSWR
jgi:hypothetical protein